MSHLKRLADEIADYGVRHVFGIPGSGPSLTLLDHLEARGVAFHLVHFEGCAAIMAGTVARLGGTVGVCVGIKGPGLSNMLPGLAAASLESFPVVSITEAYPSGTPPEKAHKRMDHHQLVAPAVKGIRFLAADCPGFAPLADWAAAEPPGPVHLDIAGGCPETGFGDAEPEAAAPNFFGDVRALLAGASKPVVIAGTVAIRAGLHGWLNALDVPVFSTAAAKGVVDETLDHAAGVYTGAGRSLAPEKELLEQADLVIGIGLRHNEVLSAGPFAVPALLLDPLGDGLATGFAAQAVDWPADAEAWDDLARLMKGRGWGADLAVRLKKRMRNALLDGRFMPAEVFRAVEAHYDGRARLVMDTGLFCVIGEHVWRVPSPELHVSSGQGRYMGIGLPQGVASAIHDPGVDTVVFCGDGGIGMFVSELKLAAAERLPLVVVLMSDGGFGTLRGRARKDSLTEQPLTVANPSWRAAVEGLGVPAVEAGSIDEILAALLGKGPGPLFIETHFPVAAYANMLDDLR